jgi:ankyrin repeat protein
VIRLLLARGAGVRANQGKPAADAFPTFFASRAGNAEIIPALHRAGDALESTTIMFGTLPVAPLTIATAYGDTDVMRTLIDLGTKVDPEQAKRDGALAIAVQGHQIKAARLLIAHGADVNRPGDKGRTPLMHAAVADFGDSTLLDLLLKSGARTDVRDEEGLTAADYARTYHHEELIARLK